MKTRERIIEAAIPVFASKGRHGAHMEEIANKGNVHLSLDEASGKTVMAFDEIPVRRCDVLHYNETSI